MIQDERSARPPLLPTDWDRANATMYAVHSVLNMLMDTKEPFGAGKCPVPLLGTWVGQGALIQEKAVKFQRTAQHNLADRD